MPPPLPGPCPQPEPPAGCGHRAPTKNVAPPLAVSAELSVAVTASYTILGHEQDAGGLVSAELSVAVTARL